MFWIWFVTWLSGTLVVASDVCEEHSDDKLVIALVILLWPVIVPIGFVMERIVDPLRKRRGTTYSYRQGDKR